MMIKEFLEIPNGDFKERYYIEYKNNEFNYYFLINGIFVRLNKNLVEFFGITEDVCLLYTEIFE